ncbi:MAG: substrate-binding domain-containing protein, partial [Actinomycetota bacterium]|nr:substrate-binding domain-containing protein [Actinomycetota bacterium]
ALDVADELEHAVLIVETHSSAEAFARAVDVMTDRRADALLVASMNARQIPIPETPQGLPLVTLNCAGPRPTLTVLPAEREAGYAVARSLVDAGHQKIAVVGRDLQDQFDPSTSVTLSDRLRGIRDAFDEAGLDPVAVADYRVWEPAHGYEGAQQALAVAPGLTAMLCLNDRLAFGAYQALQETGRRIPEDVSVASFDDDVLAGYLRPGLTTARIPYREMGREAMRLCLTGDATPTTRFVPMPLVSRHSIVEPR